MKSIILTSAILFLCNSVGAQTAKEIMALAIAKSNTVQNGYYEMTRKMKYMSKKDTLSSTSTCFFKKLPNDTLFGFSFYSPYKDSLGILTSQLFFTGDALVRVSYNDSTATITSVDKWSQHIDNIKHNYHFFDPLTRADDLQDDPEDMPTYFLLDDGKVKNIPCHHVRIRYEPQNEPGDPMKILRIEKEYWISKSDALVHRYTTAFDMVMDNDTMYQFEDLALDSVSINSAFEVPSFSSIPSFILLKDYTPDKEIPLLDTQTIAPEWSLKLLSGDSLSLKDLEGKLVLVDFFYKACFPCMQALPVLQSLHEKFEAKGLTVLGIDPYDKEVEDLRNFLVKRGVTYKVLLCDKEIPKSYNVTGYPTMYLIDKNGMILYAQAGYGEGTEAVFNKIIEKHLK